MLSARSMSCSLACSRFLRAVSSWRWFSSILACTVASCVEAWLYFSTAISDCMETSERRASTAARRALALATEPAADAAGTATSMTATTPKTARRAVLRRMLRWFTLCCTSGVTPEV